MEFKTEAQKNTYEKIRPWIKELFGTFSGERKDAPVFGVRVGSALTEVYVDSWGDDEAVICARSYVVIGPEMTAELMLFLLRANNRMRFGAFGLDSKDNVFFEQTILGSTCDKEELHHTVQAVLTVADEYDDKIVQQWGGKRMAD